MLGTGCLQAIQLIAYTTMYNPNLLLLDEPDAHLHPSNQRLLANILISISQSTETRVITSTHSRHIFDALAKNEICSVVWLKDGEKQTVENVSDLSLLLDLGALDSFEQFASPTNRVVVLTEDSKSSKLKKILESNGSVDGEYFIQALHGVDNVQSALPVADFFTKLGSQTHVLIHRDGDALLPAEKDWLKKRVTNQLPPRSTLLITPLTDVEHQFCTPQHIANTLDISEADATTFVNSAILNHNAVLSVHFANKRQNAKDRVLRNMDNVPSASELVGAQLPFEFAKGKVLLGQIIKDLDSAGLAGNRILQASSDALKIPELQEFSQAAWSQTI